MGAIRIILAGGDPVKRAKLDDILSKINCATIGGARYGKQVTAMVAEMKPDLVIVDMDNMSGAVAAVKHITAERLAPVVLMTAFNRYKVTAWTQNPGVMACVVKPVEERSLYTAIQIALSRWQEFQNLERELADLKDTLASRKLIDRAKGIIMSARHLSEAQSYKFLQKQAMARRVSIKTIAEAVLKAADAKL